MKQLFLFTSVLILFSCNSTKDTSNKNQLKSKAEEFLNNGYKQGTIIFDENCNYLIKNLEDNSLFDPINFDNKQFVSQKKKGLKVFYKYLPLRRQSRCVNTLPIELIDLIYAK